MRRFRYCYFLGLLLCPAVLGCGASAASVTGAVTVDGAPVASGGVLFVPVEGDTGKKVGGEVVNGKYSIASDRGFAPGKYRVEITSMKPTGRKLPTGDGPETRDEMKQVLPPKFNTESTTTVEIGSGANTRDFNLSSS